MIPFNRPARVGTEARFIEEAMASPHLSGDGPFDRRCRRWFEEHLPCTEALLTPSCTQALEMAALLLDIGPGDEVVMPSYTFVSTANAFVMRGATAVFVDIRPDTMNLDASLVEAAITPRTKAIVPVHYAGVGCEMDAIMNIAERHGLYVVEDAAQGMTSTYRGRALGTIGHLGAYSFHETKNYTSGGEGGLLIVNDERFAERAEIIREKGTDRSRFFRGEVDRYSWVDLGGSYLPSELQSAYLWGQLQSIETIRRARMLLWKRYRREFEPLERTERIACQPHYPDEMHNAHMFYIITRNLEHRQSLINRLKEKGIHAVFHYLTLHDSPYFKGSYHGEALPYATGYMNTLLRLPFYYELSDDELNEIIHTLIYG